LKRRILALAGAICLLLSGCSSPLDREYSTVTEHTSKYWENGSADTLRAENYQDIVNDLMLLIGRHTENASLRLYNYGDSATVADTLDKATTEAQQQTALGSYAVEYITSGSLSRHGYYEIAIHISYRRTAEQVRNIVNASSISAIGDLLNQAANTQQKSLTVRIGYWTSESRDAVEKTMARIQKARKINPAAPWKVIYYPATGDAGILEFFLENNAQPSANPGDKNQSIGG
jgi:hypothetical protein